MKSPTAKSATDQQTLTRFCPAKINLALSVGAALPESGYHPIASWMVPIGLGDTLAIRRLPEGQRTSFEIDWAEDAVRPTAIDWTVKQDLTYRAYREFCQRIEEPLFIAAALHKRIPTGAGLGGGSSDAAAMLILLNQLVETPLPAEQLVEIAASLGSDIPFFLQSRPAIVTGLGERITPLPDRHDSPLLLIVPDFGCETGPVYRAFDHTDAPADPDESRVRHLAAQAQIDSEALFNDLAEPAMQVQPKLREIYQVVADRLEAPVHVTGSGSTLFALPPTVGEAEIWARRLAADYRIVVTYLNGHQSPED